MLFLTPRRWGACEQRKGTAVRFCWLPLISLIENCEIISVYAIKENGSPYPTKPAVFSEKKPKRMISAEAKEAMYDKPAWSEEDEEMFDAIIADIQFTQKAHTHDDNQAVYEREIDWLKSLKQRIGG